MSVLLRKIILALALLAFFLPVTMVMADDTYPRTVTDMVGRTVTIEKPIERIITNNADNARIVIALGEGAKLKGSDECTIGSGCLCPMTEDNQILCDACWNGVIPTPLQDLPLTNDRYTPNLEMMASLKPDLVFLWTSWEDKADDIQERVGAPTFVAGPDYTIEGIKEHISYVGSVLGKEKEAEDLKSFVDQEVKKVTDITGKIPEDEKLTVYFAPRGAMKGFFDAKEGRDFTRTDNSYDPLTLAGGINVAKDVADGNVNVGIEQIIAWNPDVIMVACTSPDDTGVDFILASPELQSITAVKEKKVYKVLYPNCRGVPHDRNLINMFYMAKLLYPDKFTHIDINTEGDAIMKKFLGIDGAFTEYSEYLQFPMAQKV
jgi:ABC-type Fe3+-hydroxamate transport system substrate-binding protein